VKKRILILTGIASIAVIMVSSLITYTVFNSKKPVLLLSETSYSNLYGRDRVEISLKNSSRSIFGRVELFEAAPRLNSSPSLHSFLQGRTRPAWRLFHTGFNG
jgi:hypothetical protein